MIKIKLALSGNAPTKDIIGKEMNLPFPLKIGDKIRHENSNQHLDYIVEDVQYLIDDCDDGDFYQLASVAIRST